MRRDFLSEARIIEMVRGDMGRGEIPVLVIHLYLETRPLSVVREAGAYPDAHVSCFYEINAVTGDLRPKDCHQNTNGRPASKPGG